MKKSFLAVAIASIFFAASVASATQVYDKNGTTLAIGGQIEFMAGNAGNNYLGNSANDATTRDRARLTMAGRTQLTNGIAVYAYNEWQAQHAGTSEESASLSARQQYLGVDFGKFGKVQFGRYVDPFEYASNLVDVLDEVGIYGGFDERNSGHLSYMWSGFGFDAGISYQFAVDGYRADEFNESAEPEELANIDSGFSIYAGYTSPKVVFGPISVRAAYLYLKGQDKDDNQKSWVETDEDATGYTDIYFDKAKSFDVGLAWGTNGNGLYLATHYNYSKVETAGNELGEIDFTVNPTQKIKHGDIDYNYKVKTWESVVTYGFDNGVRIGASYHLIKWDAHLKFDIQGNTALEGKADLERKYVQLIADYNVTPNFKIWVEDLVDAGSDDSAKSMLSYILLGEDENANSILDAHNSIMLGARYVF